MRPHAHMLLLALSACGIKSPLLAHYDPGHRYQSRQDAYFDGCKPGSECDRPIADPAVKEVIVNSQLQEMEEMRQ